jgi:lipopolysaccharide transport system permease protein
VTAAVPERVTGERFPDLAPGEEPPLNEPPARSLRESVREVRASRDLLVQMVRRDLATKHAGSFLGFFWSLLTPMLTVAVYATVFWIMGFTPTSGEFKDLPFALFFFGGLVVWNVMNAGLAGGTGSVVGQGYIVRKIYFPRELLPLSVVLSGCVTFLFEFAVLVVFQCILGHWPDWTIVLAVPIIAIVALLAFGAALFLSAMNVYFRDLQHFINVALQLLFWAAPIIYDVSLIQQQHPGAVKLLRLNPLTGILIGFRESVLLGKVPGLWALLYALAWAVALVLGGWWYFNRHERRMAELV